ncbi:hypothetical protein YTPLAS21_01220 [Candidatus Nitrosocosmicus sp.]|nr:hypothetical protein YTPLAS21_00840 [Candidatus Nitrosocosmicus sp.]GKS60664.1 hypothetical protein YTPLAS21_01220 [Candidatus Nitrosocosmicus sp.]
MVLNQKGFLIYQKGLDKYMKSIAALKMSKIIKTETLVGTVAIVLVTSGVSIILFQTSNATRIDNMDINKTIGNTTITNFAYSNPVLGRIFLNGTDTLTSFNSINKTFTQVSYTGERRIKPPLTPNITINGT